MEWEIDGKWAVYDQYDWETDRTKGKKLFRAREDAEQARDEMVRASALAWRERPLGNDTLTRRPVIDAVLRAAVKMPPVPDVHPGHPDKRRFSEAAALWVAEQFVTVEAINGDEEDCDFIDRCSLEMTLRAADVPRFAEFAITEPGEKKIDDTGTPGLVNIRAEDADLGWYRAREAAAKAGIPFHGTHADGSEYDSCAFVSLDGEMVEVPADRHGTPSVGIGEDLRPLVDKECLRAYFGKLKAVKKLFGEKERTATKHGSAPTGRGATHGRDCRPEPDARDKPKTGVELETFMGGRKELRLGWIDEVVVLEEGGLGGPRLRLGKGESVPASAGDDVEDVLWRLLKANADRLLDKLLGLIAEAWEFEFASEERAKSRPAITLDDLYCGADLTLPGLPVELAITDRDDDRGCGIDVNLVWADDRVDWAKERPWDRRRFVLRWKEAHWDDDLRGVLRELLLSCAPVVIDAMIDEIILAKQAKIRDGRSAGHGENRGDERGVERGGERDRPLPDGP